MLRETHAVPFSGTLHFEGGQPLMTQLELSHSRTWHPGQLHDLYSALLCALLLWLPLPFGSVVPWAHDVFRIAAFSLLIAWLASPGRLGRLRSSAVPAAALAALGVLGLLQSMSWPAGMVRWLSPGHHALATPASESTMALSLAPEISHSAGLSWLAVAACVLVAAELGARAHRRRWLLFSVTAAAVFQIVYGAQHWMSGSSMIWGIETATNPDRLRGTFVNSDHFAMFMEIALGLLFAWLWWAWRRREIYPRVEQRMQLLFVPATLWLLCFAGMAFSGSRAALMALGVGVLVQIVVIAARERQWRVGAAGLLVPVLGVCVVAGLGVQAGFGRWLGTSQVELTWNGRLASYVASLELWQRFPWFGTGMASFRDAFPLVQPTELHGGWWHAHNDLLEVLVTMGVVGACIMAIGVVYVFFKLLRIARAAEKSEHAAAAVAALGACAAVLVHSLFDFGLTMPANAVTLAVVCGAALAVPVAKK